MSTIRVVKDKNYSVINNTVLNDPRLTWEAKGLAAYLFSRPDDWHIKTDQLWHASHNGINMVKNTLRELERYGYLRRRRFRSPETGLFVWEQALYETPIEPDPSIAQKPDDGKPCDGNPSDGKPCDGFPSDGKPDDILSTEGLSTNYQEGRQEGKPSLPSLPDAREREETAADETPDPDPAAADDDDDDDAAADPDDPDDTARSIALLTDPEIGLDEPFARGLAEHYPFEEIRLQVFRLRRDLGDGSAKSWGALAARLKGRWSATLTKADKNTRLWRRHETDTDRRRAYDPYYQEEQRNGN